MEKFTNPEKNMMEASAVGVFCCCCCLVENLQVSYPCYPQRIHNLCPKQSKHVVLDNKYFIKKNLYIWYRLPSRFTEVKILQVDVTTSESRIEVDSLLTRMYDFPLISTA